MQQQIRKHITWEEEVGKKQRKMGSGNTETNEGRGLNARQATYRVNIYEQRIAGDEYRILGL